MVRWFAAGALLALFAGCSAPQPAPSASNGGKTIAQYLEQARQSGADERQIETLERARDRGEVTFEDLNELAQLTMQCLADAGFTVTPQSPVEVAPGVGSAHAVLPLGATGWDER